MATTKPTIKKYDKKKSLVMTPEIKVYKDRLNQVDSETINSKTIDLSKSFDTAVLVFVSDWHIGVPDFDLDAAIETLNYVLNTPNAVLFCLGDMLNTAILGAVSNMYEDLLYPGSQSSVFIDLFKQVAEEGKLTVIHEGNHERRIEKQTGENTIQKDAKAMGLEDIAAQYYAERKIILKNSDAPSKPCEFFVITHHGDGVSKIADVKKLSNQNIMSSLNVVGHLHKYGLAFRDIEVMDNDDCKLYRQRVIDMILPSNGDGTYGDMKMYGKKLNSSYKAIQVTCAKNLAYNPDSESRVSEREYVPAFSSISIKMNPQSTRKQEQINVANKVIDSHSKAITKMIDSKIDELMALLTEQGVVLSQEIVEKLNQFRQKSPNKPVETKTKITMTNNRPKKTISQLEEEPSM